MQTFLKTHSMAHACDMLKVVGQSVLPGFVLVRDLLRADEQPVALLDIAYGPFSVKGEPSNMILYGCDKKTRKERMLRIMPTTNEKDLPLLQIADISPSGEPLPWVQKLAVLYIKNLD